MRARLRQGFSLIEALAALMIASVVLLSIYSLQQKISQAERRYERTLALGELERSVTVLLRDLNPAVEPVGSIALAGGRRAVWRSHPRGEFEPAPGGEHQVRLYRVVVTLTDPDGGALETFAFDRVGWRGISAAPAGSAGAR